MKGFKKDGKFRPTEKRYTKNSLTKKSLDKKSLSSPSGGGHEMRDKKTIMKHPEISIQDHDIQFSWDEDEMRLGLGNWTDAGWRWTGDNDQLLGFLIRIKGHNHEGYDETTSEEFDKFVKDFEEQGGTFEMLKPDLMKSIEEDDGIYELTGDNVRWHFGYGYEGDSGDNEHYNTEEDIDYRINEDEQFKGKLTDDDKEGIMELVWDVEIDEKYNYDFDTYMKEHGGWIKSSLKEAVQKSESFGDLAEGIQNIVSGISDQERELEWERVAERSHGAVELYLKQKEQEAKERKEEGKAPKENHDPKQTRLKETLDDDELQNKAHKIVNMEGYNGRALDHDTAYSKLRKEFPKATNKQIMNVMKNAEEELYGKGESTI